MNNIFQIISLKNLNVERDVNYTGKWYLLPSELTLMLIQFNNMIDHIKEVFIALD